MKHILALDLGTIMGWALNNGNDTRWGHFDLKPTTYESDGMRYVYFQKRLNELFINKIDLLVYEEVHGHLGKAAARVYAGYLAIMQAHCAGLPEPVNYTGVKVHTLKTYATGRGNAGKAAMIDAATKMVRKQGYAVGHAELVSRTNPIGMTDDEADAICLLNYAMGEWG